MSVFHPLHRYSGDVCLGCGALLTYDDRLTTSPHHCPHCRNEADREAAWLALIRPSFGVPSNLGDSLKSEHSGNPNTIRPPHTKKPADEEGLK